VVQELVVQELQELAVVLVLGVLGTWLFTL